MSSFIGITSVKSALRGLSNATAHIVSVWLSCCILLWFLFLLFKYLQTKLGRQIKPSSDLGILITGATSGIGLAVTKHCFKLGFSVFACYYSDKEAGYSELKELAIADYERIKFKRTKVQEKPELFLIPMNVRSPESIKEAAKQVDSLQNIHGIKLHCLINNAGIAADGPLCLTSSKSLEATVGTNLLGAMLVSREFLLKILQSKGRIINVSSGLYRLPTKWSSVYIATKSGIASFSRSIDRELREVGGRCICLCPANLIGATNIILTTLKNFQQSEPLLTDEERKFNRGTIDGYRSWMNKFYVDRLGYDLEGMGRYAEAHNVENSDFNNERKDKLITSQSESKKSWFSCLMDHITRTIVGGGFNMGGLVNSRIEYSFEQAIRLENPPAYLYPGSWFYSNFTGHILEFLPPMILEFLVEPGRRVFFT